MKTSLKKARKYEAENNNAYQKDRPRFSFYTIHRLDE